MSISVYFIIKFGGFSNVTRVFVAFSESKVNHVKILVQLHISSSLVKIVNENLGSIWSETPWIIE